MQSQKQTLKHRGRQKRGKEWEIGRPPGREGERARERKREIRLD